MGSITSYPSDLHLPKYLRTRQCARAPIAAARGAANLHAYVPDDLGDAKIASERHVNSVF